MIKNDRNFAIVRGRVERLQGVQDELLGKLAKGSDDRDRNELELTAVRAEIRRMEQELDDYNALKAGRAQVGTAERVEDLPRLLVRGRIAAGLTHAELADRIGVHAQQIQRYEATDYESASLSRLAEIARALNLELGPGLEATASTTAPRILRTLRKLGLDRAFLKRRFGLTDNDEDAAVTALSLASHVFGVRPDDILEGDPTTLVAATGPVAYKKPRSSSDIKTTALVGYAHYLSQMVLNALPTTPVALPDDPTGLHARMSGDGAPVTFARALDVVWEAGIPVLPLDEGGGFQAGYWRHGSRDIIVINSGRHTESLWLFYLLHEVGHISGGVSEGGLVETDPGHDGTVEPENERRANEYATSVIFGGRSAELAGLAIERSRSQLSLLQRTVRWVARNHDADAGALALNVAYRLAQDGKNWWPAAMALQEPNGDPWRRARDVLVDRLDWSALGPLDTDLLRRALDHRSDASLHEGAGP